MDYGRSEFMMEQQKIHTFTTAFYMIIPVPDVDTTSYYVYVK